MCDALVVLFAGGCVSTGLMAFFVCVCVCVCARRKTSSWPCVWNYTPGSKQGRLTEKKTAVRQWITVLWPDKCLSEEWMRKLGACQESHTRALIHTLYTHILYAYLCVFRSSSHTHKRGNLNNTLNHLSYLNWTSKTCDNLHITGSYTLH